MLKPTSKRNRARLVCSTDPAVDVKTSDFEAAENNPLKYLEHVKIKDDETATIWVVQSLDQTEYQHVLEESIAKAVDGLPLQYTTSRREVLAFYAGLVEVENAGSVGKTLKGRKANQYAMQVLDWPGVRELGQSVLKISEAGHEKMQNEVTRFTQLRAARELLAGLCGAIDEFADDLEVEDPVRSRKLLDMQALVDAKGFLGLGRPLEIDAGADLEE